ncbi:hypothetical protein BWI93_23675 [Siphonobacter sp. BAB-5385]|uniref:DUF4153 domain-containing protein n=1 Tax=Siphonobacter sp. BAB-5385 TaxID=1864822 RepID=UPI000B9DEEE5|nr:DUF4153 domain-containing protein [Siphonobacter sp. BAB-5385]OZI05894.1 hypothetical protein BWI93_23675 [Siphonobacter sp. BAB-5385]
MKEQIRSQLHDPRQLEHLYRTNKGSFKREFNSLYPELRGNPLADFWHERLQYEGDELHWGSRGELLFIGIAALLAGLIAKFPVIFGFREEFFYPRNIGFIAFPPLLAYFAWKHRLSTSNLAIIVALSLGGLVFINVFPDVSRSDTLVLSCIHLLLFLWSILGFTFVGTVKDDPEKRLSYLRYNGDLIVMTTLILIAGGILTGLTLGLFELIGLHIQKFYFEYIVIFGLPAAPLVGTYLTQTNPQLVGKVSPVIAKLFSPLVLVMLVIYLIAIFYSGKDPYQDREFLLLFNALLIGVMALIFFSIAETSKNQQRMFEVWILALLSVVTIVVNGIALSAIVFRISEWGITPNRLAVLGSNILILINLLLVTLRLFKVIAKKSDLIDVGKAMAFYLPIYSVWTVIVTFLFPLFFGFK